MLQLTLVAALIFATGIAIFAVQNTTPVPMQFLGWRADAVAASVLVLVSAALGATATLFFGAFREVRLRLRLRSQGQELSTSQGRVRELEVSETPDGVAAT
jgi:lipopolysaccharide assembly protein A